jgi:hypothetical protein
MPKFKIIGTKQIDEKDPGSTIELTDLNKILTLTKAGHIEAVTKKDINKKVKKEIKKIIKDNK